MNTWKHNQKKSKRVSRFCKTWKGIILS